MSGKSAPNPSPLLNGILALGVLLVFASVAGLAATSVSGSSADRFSGEGEAESRTGDGVGLRPERINGKYGYVDEAGNVIIPARFDGADSFSEGLAVVLDSGRFGYIDSQGAFAIPAVYRHARAFQDGVAPVRLRGSWLFIDRLGKPLDRGENQGDGLFLRQIGIRK
jgi:hypothetical protein